MDLLDQKRIEQIRPHLHRYLKIRLGIYLAIAISLGGFVIYNSFIYDIPGIFAVAGVLVGIIIGYAVSRIHKISWSEKAGKVITHIDLFGFCVLILYILFEIFRSKIVGHFVDGTDVTVTSFSVLAGIMYGRVLGIRGNVVRVLKDQYLIK